MRLIHFRPASEKRLRKIETSVLSNSHQVQEPPNTPKTMSPAEEKLPSEVAKPNPLKIAAKDRIVIGLVRVRKRVEA